MDDTDRNAPATKGDVEDAIDKAKDEIVEKLRDAEDRMVEKLRDVETKLLDAFYGYAKSNDKRLLETEANEAVLRSRVAILENRITDVEHRLNMPPQQ